MVRPKPEQKTLPGGDGLCERRVARDGPVRTQGESLRLALAFILHEEWYPLGHSCCHRSVELEHGHPIRLKCRESVRPLRRANPQGGAHVHVAEAAYRVLGVVVGEVHLKGLQGGQVRARDVHWVGVRQSRPFE
eukprot:CAMPEP_0167782182 /NCGR_PEP_ID=MMETSP0111_2-20121227/6372_1 /TAXON_ID=91324 /ORGANISM="Lotharella globosa, Strain CCCM811" /LENGTH=133 /DNA_ID=CAMNT_0007672979 /DNA_START=56 /DNA_END=457 /DNA_ORIENTATION=-